LKKETITIKMVSKDLLVDLIARMRFVDIRYVQPTYFL